MAFVSRTTQDKREIRDLLIHGDSKAPAVQAEGVTLLREFSGFIRNVLRIRSPEGANSNHVAIWCADNDGGIRIRKCSDGSVITDAGNIPPVPNAHVNAMVQSATGDVWAAYSDGYVRTYDVSTLQKTFEKRRHAGAAVCLAASGKYVFSGSEDFKIVAWEALGEHRVAAQLQAHANHVRTFCVDGNNLYSSGPDGVIRCWSVHDLAENISSPFPLRVGKKEIISVFIMDGFLFAASREEVTLFKLSNGELSHIIALPANSPKIIAVAPCDATVTLWLSLADGSVSVYDLFNYEHLGMINRHGSSVVPNVSVTGRTTVNRLALVTPDGLLSLLAASDCLVEGFTPFPATFAKRQSEVNSRRSELAKNAEEIATKKLQYRALRNYDTLLRSTCTRVLARLNTVTTAARTVEQQLMFSCRRRDVNKRARAATMLSRFNEFKLLFRSYATWIRACGSRAADTVNAKLHTCIMNAAASSTVTHAVRAGLLAARLRLTSDQRQTAAHQLGRGVERRLASVRFALWMRFAKLKRSSARQMRCLTSACERSNSRNADDITWTALTDSSLRARFAHRLASTANATARSSQLCVVRDFFEKWQRLQQRRNIVKHEQAMSRALDTMHTQRHQRTDLTTLLRAAKQDIAKRAAEATALLEQRGREMDAILNDPELLSEEELDKAVKDAENEVARLQGEICALDRQHVEAAELIDRLHCDADSIGEPHSAVEWLRKTSRSNLLSSFEHWERLDDGLSPQDHAAAAGKALREALIVLAGDVQGDSITDEQLAAARDKWATMSIADKETTAARVTAAVRAAVAVFEQLPRPKTWAPVPPLQGQDLFESALTVQRSVEERAPAPVAPAPVKAAGAKPAPKAAPKPAVKRSTSAAPPPAKKADQQTRTGTGESDKAASQKTSSKTAEPAKTSSSTGAKSTSGAAKPAGTSASKPK